MTLRTIDGTLCPWCARYNGYDHEHMCPEQLDWMSKQEQWAFLRDRVIDIQRRGKWGPVMSQEFVDHYFRETKFALNVSRRTPKVTMQFFCKKTGIVSGIALVLLKLYDHWTMILAEPDKDLNDVFPKVECLVDGDNVSPYEPVMRITGDYRYFGMRETEIDGILARQSLVATNTHRCVSAAGDVPVVWFGARHDVPDVQRHDGYAALVGGAAGVATRAGGRWMGVKPTGTMPHAMIACFDGSTVDAAVAQWQTTGQPVVALVDYDNHCAKTSLETIEAVEEVGGTVRAVRLDTSGQLVDEGIRQHYLAEASYEPLRGVNPTLVRRVRGALDGAGYDDVDIFVSGGFTPEKIRRFNEAFVPVDGYGVGSSILGHGSQDQHVLSGMDFTADIVQVNGRLESKVGRYWIPSDRLVSVDWDDLARQEGLDAERSRG